MSALSQITLDDRRILVACLFSSQIVTDDVLKKAFRHLGIKLSSIHSFVHAMEEVRLIAPFSQLNWPERVRLEPKVQFELLSELTDEEFDEAVRLGSLIQPHYSMREEDAVIYGRFLKNLRAVLRGEPADGPMTVHSTRYVYDRFYRRIEPLLGVLFSDGKLTAMADVLPPKVLADFIRKNASSLKRGILTFADPLKFAERLRSADLPSDDSTISLFEFCVVFPFLGRPKERMAAMSASSYCLHVLAAVIAISRGDTAEALRYLRNGLRCLPPRTRVFPDPFSNFIYGAVLYSERSKLNIQRTMRSLDTFLSDYDDDCLSLRIFSRFAFSADEGTLLYLNSEHPLVRKSPRSALFRKLTGQALGIQDDMLAALLRRSDSPERVFLGEDHASPVWRLQYESVATPESEHYQSLCSRLGLERLIPKLTAQSWWESRLDELIEEQSADIEFRPSGRPAEGEETECLTYAVDTVTQDVVPRLRKTKDGGRTYSRGKAYRFEDLRNSKAPCITLQDRLVIKSACSGSPVIPKLIGHPYLFDANDLNHRLRVVRQAFRMTVTEEADGFHIGFNVPVPKTDKEKPEPKWIVFNGKDEFHVVSCTSSQARILTAFCDPKMAVLPLSARAKLTQLLEVLSATTTISSSLLNDVESVEKRHGDPRITFRLCRTDEGRFSAEACVIPVRGCIPVRPGFGSECLSDRIDGISVQVIRDLKAETANADRILKKIASLDACRTSTWQWNLDTAECLTLLDTLRDDGTAVVEWPEGEVFSVKHCPIDFSSLQLGVKKIGDWLSVEGKVVLDDKTAISIAELLRSLQETEGDFVRLSEKEYVALTAALRKELSVLADSAQKAKGRGRSTGISLSAFNAGLLAQVEAGGAQLTANDEFRAFLSRMNDAAELEPAVPQALRAELRDYQIEGFRWMSRLAAWGAGSILADDMGLGKTVQTVALLLDRAKLGPQLVVMPTAVLVNWEQEINRFAPGLTVRVFNRENRSELVKSIKAGDIVLTSYGVLSSGIELLKDILWKTVVLDEAHAVKNRMTKTSKAVMALQPECRVLLTGTPLQNHLAEIWNLFQFANPGLLGTYENFVDRYIKPIELHRDRAAQKALKRIVSPFILRRTKAEVLDELPKKTELTIRVPLSDKERALYEKLREHASTDLATGVINPIQALAEITKLRQAACHPELINPMLRIGSSKTEAFLELVGDLRESGHRALVFSQFTSLLTLVKRELDKAGVPYLYLDGSDTAAKRSQQVDEFQHGDAPLFLISLKAGGTGLNLTAADYVIHLDPWWNPAIENQASDRAYRIGQDRPVTIYRLISEGTIEEKILRLHETKKSLADALLEGADMSSRLSKDEILKLLSGE